MPYKIMKTKNNMKTINKEILDYVAIMEKSIINTRIYSQRCDFIEAYFSHLDSALNMRFGRKSDENYLILNETVLRYMKKNKPDSIFFIEVLERTIEGLKVQEKICPGAFKTHELYEQKQSIKLAPYKQNLIENLALTIIELETIERNKDKAFKQRSIKMAQIKPKLNTQNTIYKS